jgi:hypothetical protein
MGLLEKKILTLTKEQQNLINKIGNDVENATPSQMGQITKEMLDKATIIEG